MKLIIKLVYDVLFAIILISTLGIAISLRIYYSPYYLLAFVLVFIYCGFRMFTFAKNEKKVLKSIRADVQSRDSKMDYNPTYFPLFGFVVSFGLINQQFFLLDNSLYTINLNKEVFLSYNIDFIYFAYDNFVRAALLDIFETYNLHISRVTSDNYWILTLIFMFKTYLSLFFLKVLHQIFKATIVVESENTNY